MRDLSAQEDRGISITTINQIVFIAMHIHHIRFPHKGILQARAICVVFIGYTARKEGIVVLEYPYFADAGSGCFPEIIDDIGSGGLRPEEQNNRKN
ncbi:MAG: hypothetical protein OEZ32_06335 [Nitrospinota bacterium]|nr:hypothetical protein [Nitrospinota bacterium]